MKILSTPVAPCHIGFWHHQICNPKIVPNPWLQDFTAAQLSLAIYALFHKPNSDFLRSATGIWSQKSKVRGDRSQKSIVSGNRSQQSRVRGNRSQQSIAQGVRVAQHFEDWVTGLGHEVVQFVDIMKQACVDESRCVLNLFSIWTWIPFMSKSFFDQHCFLWSDLALLKRTESLFFLTS